MLGPLTLSIAHHVLLAALFVAGVLVPVHILRGRIVETLVVSLEGALLWYLGRMLVAGMGDTHVAHVSYAPFVGATVGFIGMSLGSALYEGLVASTLFGQLPIRLQRGLNWLFAPAQSRREG